MFQAYYFDGPYEYCPIPNEYGSSKYFSVRSLLPSHQLLNVTYGKVESGYGNTLALVASIEKRWQALASHIPMVHLQVLMPVQYCLLELIGKSRDNVSIFRYLLVVAFYESITTIYYNKHLF